MTQSFAHAISGMNNWSGTYNLYGYPANVTVNVVDARSHSIPTGQQSLEIRLNNNSTSYSNTAVQADGKIGVQTNGKYLTPSAQIYVGDNRGNNGAGVVYSTTQFTQTATHEFGHVLGVDDGYTYDADGKSMLKPGAEPYRSYYVMAGQFEFNTTVSNIDIQMMLKAQATREYQYFETTDTHTRSTEIR